jgi:hypothetical protein
MYDECELEKESGHAQQVWRCPVFCLINTLPPACVFVFCLHRHSLPPARVLCLVPFTGPPHGKKMRNAALAARTFFHSITAHHPHPGWVWSFFASFASANPIWCAFHIFHDDGTCQGLGAARPPSSNRSDQRRMADKKKLL